MSQSDSDLLILVAVFVVPLAIYIYLARNGKIPDHGDEDKIEISEDGDIRINGIRHGNVRNYSDEFYLTMAYGIRNPEPGREYYRYKNKNADD